MMKLEACSSKKRGCATGSSPWSARWRNRSGHHRFPDRDVFAAAASGAPPRSRASACAAFTGTRHFPFPETMASEDEMLGAFIRQYYGPGAFVPGEIFVSHPLEDAALIEEWLSAGPEGPADAAERGERRVCWTWRDQCRKRAPQPDAGPRRTGTAAQLRAAALSRLPRRIECFDNSTLAGRSVAGMVCLSMESRKNPPTAGFSSKRWRPRMITPPCPRS
jgi:excinuclease UvrABC nuclease subunit